MEQYGVEVWNVAGLENELIARTNNPLERFNRELNSRFPSPRPSVATFVGVVKTLSSEYVQRLADVPHGRVRRAPRERIQLPVPVEIPEDIADDSDEDEPLALEHASDSSLDEESNDDEDEGTGFSICSVYDPNEILPKRAKNQLMECARTVTPDTTDFVAGRMVNYHSDLGVFEDMLVILEGAYREMDAVFCTNGLNSMEVTYKDTQVREGDDGIYLDVFSNKVLPFDLDITAKAVWDHFKGADKHKLRRYDAVILHSSY
ncbi:hypothetical protein PC114_g25433 [Phytophthora cactorum]|nr:hypothetical protein PC114_g25433 [Phytophthora cactorum]